MSSLPSLTPSPRITLSPQPSPEALRLPETPTNRHDVLSQPDLNIHLRTPISPTAERLDTQKRPIFVEDPSNAEADPDWRETKRVRISETFGLWNLSTSSSQI
jgi:hypothetical protein